MFLYTLCYLLFCSLVVHPPAAFASAGLTLRALFAPLLGSEDDSFVAYHTRRARLYGVAHACLPALYGLGLAALELVDARRGAYAAAMAAAIALPAYVASRARSERAIRRNLAACAERPDQTCDELAAHVDRDFKSVDKISLALSADRKTVVTQEWIVHVEAYAMHFARQRDAVMVVKNSDTHRLSPSTGGGEQQYIDVDVRSETNRDVAFAIRLNSLDFKELQSKVMRPIVVLPHIVFHKTTIDKFIDVFKDQIALNDKYATPEELEPCIGCMQTNADVKLFRRCRQDDTEPACQVCGCRPMWCADCMARWFATRQDANHPENWLSEKCTCPLCRQVFCVYDVCYVESTIR